MDLEKLERQNWLKKWRERESLSPETVDRILSWPQGLTQKYESLGLMRVPCCYLSELARLYRVPALEFHKTIWSECERFRRRQPTH